MYTNKSVRGAVSVFIVLILVPCIVASSLFIDVGRVALGQGVATSAADLALNSLMSNYDEVLTDYYGFIASCQNIEEFYDETAEYFLAALRSQGLSDDDIDSLFAVYQKYIGDTDQISDLMQLNCLNEDLGGIVSSVGGASVGGSSAIIKDQMVEFMKFRGPINILSNVIDRLSKNDVSKVMEQAEESEAVIDSKEEFANDEEALLKALFDTYTYIRNYEKEKITPVRLEDLNRKMVEYRKYYKEINEKIVTYLHDTSNVTTFTRPTCGLGYNANAYTASNVCSEKETVDDVEKFYISVGDAESIFDNVSDKISEFKTAKNTVVNNVGTSLINSSVGYGTDDANPVQWVKQVLDKMGNSRSTVLTKAQNMISAYNKMIVMYDKCTLDYDATDTEDSTFADNYASKYESLKEQVESLQSTYLKSGVTSSKDNYLILMTKLETNSKSSESMVKHNNIKLSDGTTIDAKVKEISSFLDTEATALKNAIDALDIAIDGSLMMPHVKSLDSVKNLVKDYHSSFKTWSGKVNALDDSNPLAQSEKEELKSYSTNEIDNGQNDGKPRQIKITEADVTELKTRLVNIRNQLQTAYDAINEFKYGGKKIQDLNSYSKVYDAIKGKIGTVPLTNSQITKKANTVFSTNFNPYSSEAILSLPNLKDDNHNPNLTQNKPKLYSWMGTKFKTGDGSKYDTQKNKVNGIEDSGSKKEEEAKNKTKEDGISKKNITDLSAASDFPSGLDKSNSFGILNGIGSIGSLIGSLVKGEFTSIRDSLYATEYVMSMFSYATFDEEGKYNLVKESKGSLEYGKHNSAYESVKDQWESEDLTFTENKTLTNKMINAKENVAFGAEAEYVLYGKTNKENVKDAFGDIYTVRYALNTISGFQHFWSLTKENATAVAINTFANGICAASSGIIPASVVKVACILLISAIETGRDIDRLKEGFPVEIYKTEHTQWETGFSGGSGGSNKEFSESSDGIFYSDYIYLFLCLGFQGNNGSKMYLRVGDLIQANMRQTQGDKYTLKKSKVYFQINAKVRVDPLMLELPMVSSYTEGIGVTEHIEKDDWCTFNVKVIRGYS